MTLRKRVHLNSTPGRHTFIKRFVKFGILQLKAKTMQVHNKFTINILNWIYNYTTVLLFRTAKYLSLSVYNL